MSSRGETRRGALAAAVGAAGAAKLLQGVAEARGARPVPCIPATPALRRHALALAPGGRTVWVADTGAATITAYATRDLAPRRSIDVGEPPLDLAVVGDRAFVVAGFGDRARVVLVDLRTGRVVERLELGPAPRAVAAAGGRVWVVGGAEDGWLRRAAGRGDSLRVGRHPRGVAALADGTALVTLNGDAALAVVRRGRVRRIPTPPFPHDVAASRDGHRAFISHDGFGERRVTPVDLERGRVGRPLRVGPEPAGLALSGSALLVAERGRGTVAVHDSRSGRRRRRVRAGHAPRAVAVHGRRALVLCEETGRLTEVRL